MKRKTLLLLVMSSFITVLYAQKKQKAVTGYAITAAEKGGRSWKEVRLVNMSTGEELKSIYQSAGESEALNARTGKPVQKKAAAAGTKISTRKIVNLDQELDKASDANNKYRRESGLSPYIEMPVQTGQNRKEGHTVFRVRYTRSEIMQAEKPFATNSAAMAYDKKHERLYYTPMGINQLRYIDLKPGTPKIYYFEDEPFGVVSGPHDAPAQITRMVIAADGNGYALSNDGNHLIRFTTGRKPVITDLGALADDASNGTNSVHSRNGYGGDLIADASGLLYLVTANRNVFKISIDKKAATFMGPIRGLPRGFSTNGAMVEEGSKIIVASSQSTEGYYRFDLNTLQAEKVSEQGAVFNASDLANGNLARTKKKNKQETVKEVNAETTQTEAARESLPGEAMAANAISMYPNPAASNSFVRLSFDNQPAGKYQVQLIDLAGRTVRTQEFAIQNKTQVVDFGIPEVARGSYLVKIVSETNKVSVVNKLMVQ